MARNEMEEMKMPTTYYIDPEKGCDSYDALSPENAKQSYRSLHLLPGDTILFKRGTVQRDVLEMTEGERDAPITYGAYGEGEKPRFLGSANITDAQAWTEEQPNIWRYQREIPGEVCNVIFNGGESCGNLSWTPEELAKQGDWHYTQIGKNDSREEAAILRIPEAFYLYSKGNPGDVYENIECAVYGQRTMLKGRRWVIAENLAFCNSGVHGYGESKPEHVVIRHCEFRFIGGCIWSRRLKIRFGNGVECWDGGHDCLIEGNMFDNVYDSCVTHQGSDNTEVPERIYFLNNTFQNYGMAAYECRDRIGRDIRFDGNRCIGAGEGFALQNETPPRRSEIWPQPLGHHVFIWRIDNPTDGGQISVQNNVFYKSPYGAAIYSIINPEAEKQFIIDHNRYYKESNELLIRMAGKNFALSEFTSYQAETGQDRNSCIEKN